MAHKLQAMTKSFYFYNDPGHGWLAVKRKLLDELGIADKVSSYSYQHGQTVYLEEDCDALLFENTFVARFGSRPATVDRYTSNDSPVRRYEHYQAS